jgi:hypothetical protein
VKRIVPAITVIALAIAATAAYGAATRAEYVAQVVRLRSKRIKLTNRAIHACARSRKAHQFRRLMGRANTAEVNAESLVADFHFQHCTPLLAD